MWIRVEGGSDNVDKDFLYFKTFLRDFFGFLKAYLVVFGLFLPKKEDIFFIISL